VLQQDLEVVPLMAVAALLQYLAQLQTMVVAEFQAVAEVATQQQQELK
jgi:hypothetical protein